MDNYFRDLGYSQWDFNSMIITYIPQMVAPVLFVLASKGLAKKLAEFSAIAKVRFNNLLQFGSIVNSYS